MQAYHPILVEPKDIPQTAVTISFGLYNFVRMPFELWNAGGNQCSTNIPVLHRPKDILKTGMTTSFGLYNFVRMPFGLWNAAQTFQHFIDQVLQRLHYCYA